MTLAFDSTASDSPLARLDARWRLAALVPPIIAVGALQSPIALAGAFVLSIGLLAFASLPRQLLLARLSAFGLFLLPFLVILPIMQGWDGLSAAAKVAVRTGSIFALTLVLIGVAPLHRNIQAMQALGVPRLFTQIALLTHRYVFVLRDEFLRIRTAMRVRGFRPATNRHTYRTVGYVAGSLLLRGEERSQRVAQAMRCRGFSGRLPSLHEFRTHWSDVIFFIASLAATALLLAGDWFLRT
jgi:cobalt/nickel transport system permease protein